MKFDVMRIWGLRMTVFFNGTTFTPLYIVTEYLSGKG